MLLRIRKRRTSTEPGNRADFVRAEFLDENGNPDRQLSVYDIQASEIVQAHTEHYAAIPLDPKGQRDLDVSGLHEDVRESPSRTPFAFTLRAHRELLFSSDAEIEEFASQLIRELSEREHEVTKSEMQDYVKSRVRDGDCEWLQYGQRANPKWKKWIDSARVSAPDESAD